MRKRILCNECYKPLTEKDLSKYPIMWQHSGDMYCDKHETREAFEDVYPLKRRNKDEIRS